MKIPNGYLAEGAWKCPTCGRLYKTEHGYELHFANEHREKHNDALSYVGRIYKKVYISDKDKSMEMMTRAYIINAYDNFKDCFVYSCIWFPREAVISKGLHMSYDVLVGRVNGIPDENDDANIRFIEITSEEVHCILNEMIEESAKCISKELDSAILDRSV